VFIEKVPDVANLGFASLVFGQALNDQPFSLSWALVGLLSLIPESLIPDP
jgi:hypothetical protein